MLGFAAISSSQTSASSRITQVINNNQRIVLSGNTRPEATAANDAGPVDASMNLAGLQLVLKRSPQAQSAFDQYVVDLTNPKSPNFHQWLTNQQIGEKYGPSAADVTKISDWLEAQGFAVHGVSPDGMTLEFSGSASAVAAAFHAPLHNLVVNGASHFGNMNDPQMPAALAPVVGGIAKLNNFQPHSMARVRANKSAIAKGNAGAGENYLGAADLATIYNFKPIFASGITGKGQTIVLIEDTDQYSVGDWSVFRKILGLSRSYPYATLTQVHPAGSNTCSPPGVNGDDGEAAIDIEWASAAAPNAAIVNAACADTTQFGGFLALANLLQGTPPKIVSISYGEAEAELGATENVYINNLYQTAAAQGVSVFVSSGDEGAASADANQATATHGIGVSGFTSTPYNISVGGTDFGFAPLGTPGTYFSSSNGPNFQTALSYVPEIPWNDSCTSSLIVNYLGYPSTTGPDSFCNLTGELVTTASGSGGPSGCATGVPTTSHVVSGTCAGYAKPSWQSLVGVPADGVRDIPDVSLFAANGVWGSYYTVCYSDPAAGETPCGPDPAAWAGYGGTSISSPIWAGIQALVNQSTGLSWGNSNPVLYTLANSEYGGSGDSGCNSSLGNAVGGNCVFYDITQGDMAVDCAALRRTLYNCFNDGGTYGVLSTSNSTKNPAYGTNVGWDFATGIGTTNASNLVNAWTTYATTAVRRY
jgi:subtilase family serine protease